jgi:hypothetical protein
MNPITEVIIEDYRNSEASVTVKCEIESTGSLKYSSYTIGRAAQDFFGHDDCEYAATVLSSLKDTILLLLIKERFKKESQFTEWLEENGISHQVDTWP